MKSLSFTISTTFPAKPAEIFDALTNPKKIAQWSGKGFVSPKVFGKFSMFDGWVTGIVLDYKPGKTLSVTWRPNEWLKDWKDSEVRFAFTATKGGTKMTLIHSKLPNATELHETKLGWFEYVFEPLKAFLQ
jgi:uncharacterized protein YndB with AHSA1/START domain